MHRAPGGGGLEGSTQPQTYSPTPNATLHFTGAPLPQEGPSPGLARLSPKQGCFWKGRKSWQSTSSQITCLQQPPPPPLPTTTFHTPGHVCLPGGEAQSSFQLWLLPVWSWCRMQRHRACSKQDPQPARAARIQRELLNHTHLGCTAPSPEPPKQVTEHPQGWME